MDLAHLLRVLWRFRFFVAVGVLIATSLAAYSFVKVDLSSGSPTVSYRDHEQWESLSTIFVTTRGFPWGSVELQPTRTGAGQPDFDPAALTSAASLYMELATGDEVLRRMSRDGPIDGFLQAFPVRAGRDSRGDLLPMITLSAIAATPPAAHRLAQRHVQALIDVIRTLQSNAQIPSAHRVQVEVLRQPQTPVLLEPRKRTRPIVVFMAVMFMIVGIAFVLENLRPRVHPVNAEAEAEAEARPVGPEPMRRTA
jgi:hypothetical protein